MWITVLVATVIMNSIVLATRGKLAVSIARANEQ